MIRAYKALIKGQTRRLVKPQPDESARQFSSEELDEAWGAGFIDAKCPYGQPGDRLWFREAWMTLKKWDHLSPSQLSADPPITYLADEWVNKPTEEEFGKYRHSRFMMRAFARFTTRIIDIRPQWLLDISEEDAEAEGIQPFRQSGHEPSYVENFRLIFQKIHGVGVWKANPLVWVIEFERGGGEIQ